MIPIGRVRELVRYPVKSMRGTAVESAELGWNGLAGDRRFAFRKLEDRTGFPWLTASSLPALVTYAPVVGDRSQVDEVRTPAGELVALRGPALQDEIAAQFGSPVELMELRQGIFDDAPVSVISLTTMAGIGAEAGMELDRRRMRANIVLETDDPTPFLEDGWVGGTLRFGDGESAAAVTITMRDVRCVMVNLDPETGEKDARVMKAVVRLNANGAGVYGTVTRTGTIQVGQAVSLVRS
jgi:uncharacterized protein YcbX